MSTIKDQTELGGMLGESLTVRKVNGRVVIKNRPQRKTEIKSDKQVKFKDKFLLASQYATRQMKRDDVKALYEAAATGPKQTAYAIAVRDFLIAPTVKEIDASEYRGQVGDWIVVTAIDDFMVKKVRVTIKDGAGNKIEEGEAGPDAENVFPWVYIATIANPLLPGTKIEAVAYDRPGNKGRAEVVL
ncbi:MAG: hypothetical protein H7Y31_07990 [Chitinophagaceae bacterium]|nr:hypothetical protein [Chitinophagaceae bacterium]